MQTYALGVLSGLFLSIALVETVRWYLQFLRRTTSQKNRHSCPTCHRPMAPPRVSAKDQ
jgi:hypothetical protein